MGSAFYQTEQRKYFIQNKMPDYQYVEMWECEFARDCKYIEEFQNYIQHNPLVEPLKPREALKGGRAHRPVRQGRHLN